ncbi:hypothetical protein Tco_0656934 [Tanacetum coccineum]|uniref:Uncharacterized protein n=1 Tax=Tanacetum coccineum TaxID=301880 RepID=A0ABQ4XAU9_9ASTR
MGSGQEWSSEDQRDIFILGYVQDDKSMGKINLPILTSTFSAKPLGCFIVLSASSMVNLNPSPAALYYPLGSEKAFIRFLLEVVDFLYFLCGTGRKRITKKKTEKQSQNDKTDSAMEMTVKNKAQIEAEKYIMSIVIRKVITGKVKVNPDKSKVQHVKKYKFEG